MTKRLIIGLTCLGTVGLFLIIFLGTVFGFRSDCVGFENAIPAQFDQNRNNYDNMWKRFREMAQLPVMYEGHVKEVFNDAMRGRYGAQGASSVFLALKEDNPKLDPSLYTKVQTAIEAGRVSFAADQTSLIDKKRQYGVLLGSNTALVANLFFGYPHIDLNKYDIVTSDQTEKAFVTKKADEIKLN